MLSSVDALLDRQEALWWAAAALAALVVVQAAWRRRKRKPQVGEIWFANVPFDDGTGSKDRPVLVLSVSGRTCTVARFTSEGQKDTTFTADGRFDSLFSLSAAESASDISVLPDGHILAAGQSGTFGVLLRLRGTSVDSSLASTPVVEFFNTALNHYFVTAGPGEIINVEWR